MDPRVEQALKEGFVRRLQAGAPGFSVARRAEKKNGSGPCLLEWRVDSRRKAWLAVGGVRDSDTLVALEAGWTTEGGSFAALPEVWLGDRPWPARGRFLPLLDGQFAEVPTPYTGLAQRVDLPSPPAALCSLATQHFMDCGGLEREIASWAVWEARKKAPASTERIREMALTAHRAQLRLWSGTIAGLADDECLPFVEAACAAVMDDLFADAVPRTLSTLRRLLAGDSGMAGRPGGEQA